MADSVLVHSCTVYLYLYDAKQGGYAQQTDAALGCALLAVSESPSSFKLLLYNAQKQPILETPVTPATRFTPQQNAYVNFYAHTQANYSMRFKDNAASAAFLIAAALAKAQMFVQDPANYSATTRPWSTQFDEIDTGKESSGSGIAQGDVAGLECMIWEGSLATSAVFFTSNPLDIAQQTPSEQARRDGQLKRVHVGDGNTPEVSRALADGLVGMHKHGRRIVALVLPSTQQWAIADVELIKVKKAKNGSIAAPAPSEATAEQVGEDDGTSSTASHDEIVQRMAHLSRKGSQSSGLIANLNAASPPLSRQGSANWQNGGRSFSSQLSSVEEAISAPGYTPVPLPGIVTMADLQGFASRRTSSNQLIPPSESTPVHTESLASRVIGSLKEQNVEVASFSPGSPEVSSDLEKLLKEQSELDQLRKQLEESKRKLEQQDSSETIGSSGAPSASTASFSSNTALALTPTVPSIPTSMASNGINGYTPWQPPSSQPFSSTLPSGLGLRPDLLPPFTPSSLIPSPLPPTPSTIPSLPNPMAGSYGSTSLTSYQPPSSNTQSSPEVENGLMRLQRSSTSIESTLQDLQSKLDRLLNLQNSMKPSKYASSSLFSSSGLSAGSMGGVSSGLVSSSSSLLKNLEKALAQRDQLQDLNGRLQEAKDQMESTIEELQSQHESLQLENRNLLDKLQNGNHLQQEKFRLELRNVQQQLSHTQEQMLVFQEENFRLRQELAAKDEQVVKEKAQLQDEARKQLEQLQRQLQVQVHQDSKDAMERLQSDKLRLEKQANELTTQKAQAEIERDSMANQLRILQSQQSQWQDEQTQSQAMQDARVKDLQVQFQQSSAEMAALKQQLDKYRSDNRQLQDQLLVKDEEMTQLQRSKTKQEYSALSELLKEFMNDIYFHFQDAFEEDAEFTGKEIVMAIRKILKQNTMEILSKLEEFWHLQHQQQS
ncbi:hypothetical protein Poli38472_001691 [Pythium oligandrum]|uniref:Uncharacterized protein n=1 Tax=Pythium oligandrum TaxID=41045 RepID=A0A8K1CTX8_PYTOL|nr:hypothetical protein Poli38472_001691 [Pythium oligandrum]|eukprot:TMW69535.1 hypothetical protein Poli38472_001691 [Pythium oligandrum]